MSRPSRFVPVLLALALAAGACGGSKSSSSSSGNAEAPVLRLGYFPNVTHATAIAGVERGLFAQALGPKTKLQTSTFNAGPAAVEAIFSNALDASYVGPNPAINAWSRSKGQAIRIISGATSGGALLVVKPAITDPAQLKGKKVASPQLGGTQDVALREWLNGKGLKTTPQGGGDVSIVPQENAQTLDTFKANQIDGAWVPEPWATRLVREGGGHVLVDERSLWPNGDFVTTQLVVRTEFLKKYPGTVQKLLRGQVQANDFVNQNPQQAQQVVNDGIAKITGKKLDPAVITGSWANMTFTDDPVASSLKASAQHAEQVGLLEKVDLKGIYDLGPLNTALRDAHEKEVKAA